MSNKNGTHSLKNRPPWMRGLDLILRTGHIAVAGILFGGFVFEVPFYDLHLWHWLTVATGVGLLLLELRHSLSWPHQGRGVMGIFHMGLPGIAHLRPDLAVPLLWATMVLGSIGSHMPRNLRHWSLLYRRVVD
ncbi:hypothetical protein EG829_04530 [bacterium]|nr:hypothetical protein [bacterium]